MSNNIKNNNITNYSVFSNSAITDEVTELTNYVKKIENTNNDKLIEIVKNINELAKHLNETNKLIIQDINEINESVCKCERFLKLPWYKRLFKTL